MARGRRGHGEGSIYQRSDGQWTATVDLGRVARPDGTLKRKRKVLYGKTRKAVAEKLATTLAEVQKGDFTDPGKLTVAEFLQRWLKSTKPSMELRTWIGYEAHVRLHITPGLGHLQLSKLTPLHLNELYLDRLAVGKSPQTVHNTHAALHTALAKAVTWHLINRNPSDAADPPKVPKYEAGFLDFEEAKRLIASLREDAFGALILATFMTAVRSGEVRALRWSDVNLETGTAIIHQTVWYTKGGPRFRSAAKNDKFRQIALPAILLPMLRQHQDRQRFERKQADTAWVDHDLVFCGEGGMPYRHDRVLNRLRAALRTAGLPAVRLHDLRHSAASLLIALNTPLKDVSEILGHSSIGITADLYGHLLPGAQQKAADKLEAALFGEPAAADKNRDKKRSGA